MIHDDVVRVVVIVLVWNLTDVVATSFTHSSNITIIIVIISSSFVQLPQQNSQHLSYVILAIVIITRLPKVYQTKQTLINSECGCRQKSTL